MPSGSITPFRLATVMCERLLKVFDNEIIGVFEPKGSDGPVDRDDQVFIPLTNMSSQIVGNNALNGVAVNGIYVKVGNQEQSEAAEFQVTNLLRLRHNLSPSQSDDFSIRNQTDIVNTFTTVVGLFTVMVVAIASISLVVGGIGMSPSRHVAPQQFKH